MTVCETTTWITPSITVRCAVEGHHGTHRGTTFSAAYEWRDGERPVKVSPDVFRDQLREHDERRRREGW